MEEATIKFTPQGQISGGRKSSRTLHLEALERERKHGFIMQLVMLLIGVGIGIMSTMLVLRFLPIL